jgi:FkbM family methyltransferase
LELTSLINKDDPVIFEIGCNDGTDTERFLKMFRTPIIFCFEIDPVAIEKFNEKIKKVFLVNAAVSNVDGKAIFHLASNTLSGSLKKPTKHLEMYPSVKFDKDIEVKTIRLDTFTMNMKDVIIDLVWMDVQGAEDLVFEGGMDTFTNRVRYILTEFSNIEVYENAPNLQKILELLPNYEVVEIPWQFEVEGNALLRNRNLT